MQLTAVKLQWIDDHFKMVFSGSDFLQKYTEWFEQNVQ